MNQKLISDALSMIDDIYIEELVAHCSSDALPFSERSLQMNRNRALSKRSKRLITFALAACLLLSMAITASAANLWGIRDLFAIDNRELSEQAEDYIQQQSDSAQEDEWSCQMTEALFDNDQLVLTLVVSCSEDYILIPTDFSSSDPSSSIGIDSDKTLGEYAKSQNRMLLNVGAGIQNSETLRVGSGFIHFENVSETQMVMLLQSEVESDVSAPQGICTVYIGGTKVELEFTTAQAPEAESAIFIPVDPNAVPGIIFGPATVTENLLGISITAEKIITDEDAFDRMQLTCAELTNAAGGSVIRDGKWYLELKNGQGTIGDTLTIRIIDVETCELIGDVVFERQQ